MPTTTTRYSVMNGRMISQTRNGVRRLFRRDPQGNVVGLYNDSQVRTNDFRYWSYGGLRSGDATATDFLFGGAWGYRHDANGRNYVRARELDTKLTQWLTVDQIWPRLMAYQYVGSNPARFVDPSGMAAQVLAPVAAGVLVFGVVCTVMVGNYLICNPPRDIVWPNIWTPPPGAGASSGGAARGGGVIGGVKPFPRYDPCETVRAGLALGAAISIAKGIPRPDKDCLEHYEACNLIWDIQPRPGAPWYEAGCYMCLERCRSNNGLWPIDWNCSYWTWHV